MIALIKKLFSYAGNKKKDLILAAVFQLLQALCDGGSFIVLFQIVTSLFKGSLNASSLVGYCVILFVCLLLRFLFEYCVNRLQSAAGYDIVGKFRLREAEKLKRLPMGVFQAEGLGRLLSTFTSDMSYVEMYCMAVVSRFVGGITTVLVTTVFMPCIDWRMTLLAVSGFIPAFFVYRYARSKFNKAGMERQKTASGAIGAVLEFATGMETVKTYGLADKELGKIDEKLKEYKAASRYYELSALTPMTLYQLCVRLGMGLIFLAGLLLLLAGQITLEVYLFFAIISQKYYGPIETIFLDYGVLNLMGLAFARIDELKKTQPLEDTGTKSIGNTDVAFSGVTFAYPNTTQKALASLDARLVKHGLNAIVGPSGSGKTTMLHLLSRFWDADNGTISIGGVSVKNISFENLMKNISIVFQDVYLFADTLRENIRLGKSDATDEEIMAAAEKARCYEFISAMPDGLNTVIGEGGNTLSGGEKQRISIARAVLKDSPIILLDEALASIDPENAYEIQTAIDAMCVDKTVLMIAHTLSHIQAADQIIVLQNGKCVQSGDHDTLLAQGGLYKKLWDKEHSAKEWRLV